LSRFYPFSVLKLLFELFYIDELMYVRSVFKSVNNYRHFGD